jgi:hypothetical protein
MIHCCDSCSAWVKDRYVHNLNGRTGMNTICMEFLSRLRTVELKFG